MTGIWLSFDLGLKGDYEGLYSWLDRHGARECVRDVAFLRVEPGRTPLTEYVKQELERHVTLNKSDRIYIVYKVDDKMKGTFLFGNRKPSPWAGYAPSENLDVVDEE
jgi:hypothetical protein